MRFSKHALKLFGVFAVIVSGFALGSILLPHAAPVITVQPASLLTVAGSNVIFTVSAKGHALSFQWYSNNVAMPWVRSPNLVLTNVPTEASGSYFVKIRNPLRQISSSTVTLTVIDPQMDSDQDGLTDAFEIFVSHTNPKLYSTDASPIGDADKSSPGGLPWKIIQTLQTSPAIYANNSNAVVDGQCGQCTIYLPNPAPPGGTVVPYTLSGLAQLGVDFTMDQGSGFVTVPEGATSAPVKIFAIHTENYTDIRSFILISLTETSYSPAYNFPARVNIINTNNPELRVFALPPWVGKASPEFGTNTALFYFVRDGDASAALTVGITLFGTAVGRRDYAALPSTITFPAHMSTNMLPVILLSNGNTRVDSTIVVKLMAVNGYQLSPKNKSATMTLGGTHNP